DATAEQIRRGFRKIALTCHPDKVRESEKDAATKRFQLIAEAYEVLSKPASRQEYDEVCGCGESAESPPATKGSQKSTSRWQRCQGCFGRFSQKDMRRCSPTCSQPVCFGCDACSSCNRKSEVHESNEYSYIRAGMALVTVYDACVFPTPNSWKVMTKLKEGATIICAGCPKVCDGDVMVPIQPRGWVDIVDLKLPRKPSAPTRAQPEAKGPKKAPTPTSAPAAEGKKAKVATPPGPEVWSKEKEEPGAVPEFMRQASRLAMDVGDTAKEYAKSGYSGSAAVASEAIRMAQAAGEQAPWLAGEAVRMASEAAGMVWGAAATAFQRRDECRAHKKRPNLASSSGFTVCGLRALGRRV
ncbi:DNAJC9, partial [Symbiodinium sp. KB8]